MLNNGLKRIISTSDRLENNISSFFLGFGYTLNNGLKQTISTSDGLELINFYRI